MSVGNLKLSQFITASQATSFGASEYKKVKNKAREIKVADNLIGTVADDMTNIIDLNEKKNSMIDSL